MKAIFARTLILAGALALPAAVSAAEASGQAGNGKPIATVNGVAIPALYADMLRQDRQAQGQPMNEEAIRETLVNMEVLAQASVKKGLDKEPKVQATIEVNRKEILGRVLLDDYAGNHPVSDEALKAEYDRLKQAAGAKEYHPRHILVASEAEAKDIIAKLNAKKAKFEDLAKKHSKDASKAKGGDLGWLAPSNVVPEFSDAMVKLNKGEYTKAPVQSPFGWHVIRLDDSRALQFPEFDQVKARIAAHLQQQQMRKYVSELRAAAKVE